MDTQIETERLTLRRPRSGDEQRIFECMQDDELPLNLGRAPFPYQLEHAIEWIEQTQNDSDDKRPFLMDHKDDGVIGSIGISVVEDSIWELGYWVGKAWWGKGYATEAGRAILNWGRSNLGAKGFIAGYMHDNPASGTVLDKLGFETAGVHRAYVRGRDREETAIRMTLNAPAELALRIPAL